MGNFTCPDCGFIHKCDPDEAEEEPEATEETKSREVAGFSIYFKQCKCGCGCGHTCDLRFGPYVKTHNAKGREALGGGNKEENLVKTPLGRQILAMRKANFKVREEHYTHIHETKTNLQTFAKDSK